MGRLSNLSEGTSLKHTRLSANCLLMCLFGIQMYLIENFLAGIIHRHFTILKFDVKAKKNVLVRY